jgi:hypothetical protein
MNSTSSLMSDIGLASFLEGVKRMRTGRQATQG